MSIPVDPDDLGATAQDRPLAYLITVGAGPRPKIAQVHPYVEGATARVRAGEGSVRNVTERPQVTMIWPPAHDDPEGFVLVADGQARLDPEVSDLVIIAIESAIWHRRGPDHSAV